MSERRPSDLNDLEYVGVLVEHEEDTAQPFRPAANVGVSELELRRIRRKSPKHDSKVKLVHSMQKVPSARGAVSQMPQAASFSVFRKHAARNIMREMKVTPANSAELLRAEEIEMELLNIQREIEFNIAKKLRDRLKPPFRPDKIELKPEQFQDISDDECRHSSRDPYKIEYQDSVDVSRYPSYTKFEIPYHMRCLNRYRDTKLKYEMQLRHELEILQDMQPTAYEAARFAIFLGPRALQKTNYCPTTVKFTPKERKRLHYLLREEIR